MKTDARVRYTRMRIREAFLQCLKEKPVNRVTVREICEIAEINRATFYTHYANPFDLLQKLEEEALDSLRAQIDLAMEKGGDLLITVIEGMANPRDGRALLASNNADPEFSARISEVFNEKYLLKMYDSLPNLSDRQREDAYRFLAGGCGNLIRHWLARDPRPSVETMARDLRRFCDAFMDSLNH